MLITAHRSECLKGLSRLMFQEFYYSALILALGQFCASHHVHYLIPLSAVSIILMATVINGQHAEQTSAPEQQNLTSS